MTAVCSAQPSILIADDHSDLIDALRLLLKGEGITAEAVTSPDAAVRAVETRSFDLVLMDLNYTSDTTSGREGLDLVERIHAVDNLLPVIVMTGWGTVDLAVEAMRHGVRDFVQKPWDNGQLLATLRTEIEAGRAVRDRKKREKQEFDEARRIQRKLLPSSMPHLDDWEIAASWQPAAGVGGDCYDAIPLGPARASLTIADVVGKGVPAALLMSNLQAVVRAFATDATEPDDLCQRVNQILSGHIAEGRFITFFYCVIDGEVGTITYANAGHYPPILVRADGSLERLVPGGPVLGVFHDARYERGQIAVRSGDRLVLFTDGITEARNAAGEEFGEDRLVAAVLEHRACSAPALQARLAETVATFTAGSFEDDATLIVAAVDQAAL